MQLVIMYFGGQFLFFQEICEGRIFIHVFVSKFVCVTGIQAVLPLLRRCQDQLNKSTFVLLVTPMIILIIKNKDNNL